MKMKTTHYFILAVLFASILFFPALGSRHLSSPDEPRVAGVSREMAVDGDRLAPKLNGEMFLEQPPLYYWTSSFLFKVFGESEYSARLPSAFAALITVMLAFLFVKRLGASAFAAFLASAILATGNGFWNMSQRAVVDMMLCLFTMAAVLSFYGCARGTTGRALWFACFVASLAGAILTKGLIGLAVPASALFFWLIVDRNYSLRTWAFLFVGAALSLLPVSIWIWMLYERHGPEAVYIAVWVNNVGRFIGSNAEHAKPFYYYFDIVLTRLLPWTIILPFALVHHFRQARSGGPYKSGSALALCWLVAPFLLLSLASGKRSLYLLPLDPAAAVITGMYVGQAIEDGLFEVRWLRRLFLILIAIVALAAIGFSIAAAAFKAAPLIWLTFPIAVILFSGAAYLACRREQWMSGSVNFILAFGLLVPFFGLTLLPVAIKPEPFGPLFASVQQMESTGVVPALYNPAERMRGAAVFYLGHTVASVTDKVAVAGFQAAHPANVLIMDSTAISNFPGARVLNQFDFKDKTVVVSEVPSN